MKMKVMIASLIVMLGACVVLAYLWIDRSISLSYARESAEANASSIRNLERLLGNAWAGMPKSTVLSSLESEASRNPRKGIVVKQEPNVIWFDETRFNFEDGKLKSIGEN